MKTEPQTVQILLSFNLESSLLYFEERKMEKGLGDEVVKQYGIPEPLPVSLIKKPSPLAIHLVICS